MKSRPCERCGAAESDEFEDSYHPMCHEVQIAYGVLAWLCFDCRKSWHKVIKCQKISKEYAEKSLRFEHWKATVASDNGGNVDDGLNLWQSLDKLEIKLNEFANEWLIQDVDYSSPNSNTPYN